MPAHAKPRTREYLESRFHENFKRFEGDACWPWIGPLGTFGYGRLAVAGKQWYAHRLSYFLHKGELVDGMVIMHSCDNPKCVNPAHLSQATNSDNIKDMHQKDRCPNNWKRAACKRGHVFDEVNTYLFRGKQCCRACRAATNKRLRLEKLAAR